MKDYYCCVICIRTKDIRYFSKYEAGESKSCRCDDCLDSKQITDRVKKDKQRSEAELSPELKRVATKLDSDHRKDVKNRLADFADKKALDAEFEI